MKIILFTGPTLPANVAQEKLPGVDIRPPAACGDVYRAARERPAIIALVDGYFDHRLSVWHKEIIWALQRDIAVYGAGSMGALRAAELDTFGMIGVGWVFNQFRSLRLEDDDEVAVAHEAADGQYRAHSEAMVNLRVTLQRAAELRIIAEASRDGLIEHLKRLFYPQRSRQALRAVARDILATDEAERLNRWLDESGVRNQKFFDAVEMLARITDDMVAAKRPCSPSRQKPFCHTNAWQALVERVSRDVVAEAQASAAAVRPNVEQSLPAEAAGRKGEVALSMLLADLQERFADRYFELLAEALERALAVALADAQGTTVDAEGAQRESERFRRQRGLLDPAATARWLSDAGLDLIGFSSLISDNVLVSKLAPELRLALLKQLPDVLRIHGLSGGVETLGRNAEI